jgi:drug/metabolite transporter (DMT)-like permease
MNTSAIRTDVASRQPSTPHLILVALAGVLAISSAAVLIRLADADPLLTAFWRLAFSALLLGPLAWRSRTAGHSHARRLPRTTLVAGIALGLHFWAWMQSIALTSIAISTLLVTTSPLWVALAAPLIPGAQKLAPRGWLGLLIALAAAAYICWPNPTPLATAGLAGPLWAIAGAILAAVYFSASARLRAHGSTSAVGFSTTAVASVALLGVLLLRSTPLLAHPSHTWLAWLALALIPQIIGHNALLWAMRWMSATVVSLLVLLEPLGAALLAAALLNERIGTREIFGGLGLLAGVALVVATHKPEGQGVSRETSD